MTRDPVDRPPRASRQQPGTRLKPLRLLLVLALAPASVAAQSVNPMAAPCAWPANLPPSPIALPAPEAEPTELRRWLVTHGPTLLSASNQRRYTLGFRRDTLVLVTDVRDEPVRLREEIRLPLDAIRRDTLYTEPGAPAPMLRDDGPDGKTYGIVLTTPFAVRRWTAVGKSDAREMERMDRVFFFNAATRRDKAQESAAMLALVQVIQQLATVTTMR